MSNYAKRREAEALSRKESNKKTAIIVLAVVAVAAIIIGGGYYLKNRKPSSATPVASGDPNYDVMDYVKLGQYEGVEVNKMIPEVTEDEFKKKKEELMTAAVEYSEFKDRGVKSGDKVTIDFDGTIDGKAFEGGSGTDHTYTLGEGSMIKGFDEGLYGVKPGEEKTLNLTFPKDYDNKDVAGKDVVFEVTISKAEEVTYQPKWDDTFAKKNSDGEYKTIASYEKSIRKDLLKQSKEDSETTLKSDVWKTIYDNAKVDGYPEYVYNTVKAKVNANIESACQSYGITEETYLAYFAGGVSKKEYILESVNNQLVTEALIKELGIELSDKEYEKLAKADLKNYGVSSIEELEENYTKDALVEHYTTQKLYDELVAKAKVTEVSMEKYGEIQKAKQEEANKDKE